MPSLSMHLSQQQGARSTLRTRLDMRNSMVDTRYIPQLISQPTHTNIQLRIQSPMKSAQQEASPPKRAGFIVSRSQPKETVDTTRTLSLQKPIPTYSFSSIQSSSSSPKVPGEIHKRRKQDSMVDEETFYNSDMYDKPPKIEKRVNYEEKKNMPLPVKQAKIGRNSPLQRRQSRLGAVEEEALYEEKEGDVQNIHSGFDLQKYMEMLEYLEAVSNTMGLDEPDILRAVEKYLIASQTLGDISNLRFAPSKRDIIKEVWVLQKELMLMICFAIATECLNKVRKSILSLLQYAVDNHIVVLSLLTNYSRHAQRLLLERGRRHLVGKGFDVLRSHQDLMASLIYKIAKNDPLFAEQFVKISDNHAERSIKDYTHSLLTFFSFYLSATKSQHSVPFLAVAPAPFLPPNQSRDYTLVIDCPRVFTDISVSPKTHRKHMNYTFRPYAQHFLAEMSAYFEIVSWSQGLPLEHNRCIGALDRKGRVKTKLHRYHCEHNSAKDIYKLGRDTSKVVVLDTVDDKTSSNVLWIPGWRGQSNDAVLAQLCPLLATIVVKKLDAPTSVSKIKKAQEESLGLGLRYVSCGVQL